MTHLTRRDFLKRSSMALVSMGAGVPLLGAERPIAAGRVTTTMIYVYKEPSYNAERLDNLADLPAIIERYRGKPLLIDVPINPDITTVNVRNEVLSADN